MIFNLVLFLSSHSFSKLSWCELRHCFWICVSLSWVISTKTKQKKWKSAVKNIVSIIIIIMNVDIRSNFTIAGIFLLGREIILFLVQLSIVYIRVISAIKWRWLTKHKQRKCSCFFFIFLVALMKVTRVWNSLIFGFIFYVASSLATHFNRHFSVSFICFFFLVAFIQFVYVMYWTQTHKVLNRS